MIDAFIDTNVLLYAASDDPVEGGKAHIARSLLQSLSFGTSVQVLQEFYVNASGKLAKNISPDQMDKVLRLIREQPVAPVTLAIFDSAIALSRRYQLSYWDAAIIAGAKELGAPTVYSEDMAHRQTYDGVLIVNPFHILLPANEE